MPTAPFFSIILPAYNAEKTIETAIASVENQTFRDFELIVIDDGSRDQTPQVLARLESRYGNIRCQRTRNAGPAQARNVGLQQAAGRYVLFLDSDDRYLEGSLQKIHDLVAETRPDILIYGFELYNRDTDTCFHEYHPADSWCKHGSDVNFSELYTNNLLNQIWNKAFRRDFLQSTGILFPDYRYGEDRLFVARSCRRAGRIAACREELYRYILGNEDSLVHSYHEDKFRICCEIHGEIRQLANLGRNADPERLNYMFVKSVFSCMTDLCGRKSPLSSREKRAKLREILRTEMVREAAGACRRMNIAVKLICGMLRTGSVWLNYLLVKAAILAMGLLPNLTISLKHQH